MLCVGLIWLTYYLIIQSCITNRRNITKLFQHFSFFSVHTGDIYTLNQSNLSEIYLILASSFAFQATCSR